MHARGAVPQFRFRQFLFACQARILLKLERPTEVRMCELNKERRERVLCRLARGGLGTADVHSWS